MNGFYLYGVKNFPHYLDDYFTLGPAGTLTCDSSIRAIQEAPRDLSVPLAPGKCEGPTTYLIFLGIELDLRLDLPWWVFFLPTWNVTCRKRFR